MHKRVMRVSACNLICVPPPTHSHCASEKWMEDSSGAFMRENYLKPLCSFWGITRREPTLQHPLSVIIFTCQRTRDLCKCFFCRHKCKLKQRQFGHCSIINAGTILKLLFNFPVDKKYSSPCDIARAKKHLIYGCSTCKTGA